MTANHNFWATQRKSAAEVCAALETALPSASCLVTSCKISESNPTQRTPIKTQASMCDHFAAYSVFSRGETKQVAFAMQGNEADSGGRSRSSMRAGFVRRVRENALAGSSRVVWPQRREPRSKPSFQRESALATHWSRARVRENSAGSFAPDSGREISNLPHCWR